jgi:hypothetical protein
LQNRGVDKIAGVTGNSANPAEIVHRFSPRSNSQGVAELSYESVRNRHFLKLQIMN